MVFRKSRDSSQRGFSQGTLIWVVVIACFGMLVKSEFFPGISKGTSVDDLLSKFGQPVSKMAIPRPG